MKTSISERVPSFLEEPEIETLTPVKSGTVGTTEPSAIPDRLNEVSEVASGELQKQPSGSRQGAWGVFGSTFATIFLAELGDKTQVATLLMTAESKSPWIVFIGAGSALVLTSLLGVLVGRWLATRVSPKTLEKSSGIILLSIAAMLVWDVLH